MLNILNKVLMAGLRAGLVAACGISVSAQVGAGAATAKAGASTESLIKGKEIAVKVVAVRESPGIPDRFIEPGHGKKFVSVQIIVDNRGQTDWDVNLLDPLGFSLKDVEGNVYDSSSLTPLGVAEPRLTSGIVDAGDFVKGWVTFEVISSVNVKSLKLRYEAPFGDPPKDRTGWIPLSAVLK